VPGYAAFVQTLRLAGEDVLVRALVDRQQFSDPDGHAEALGISSAQWCLFGQVWPAGLALAEAMGVFDVEGKRILELGCGLGLASLVLQRRSAEITASDVHPLAEPFLAYNAALNALPAVPYRQLRWDVPLATLGRFDLIIGSDILYERAHAQLLADLVDRHAEDRAEVLLVDPGRGNAMPFIRLLEERGFTCDDERVALPEDGGQRGRLLHFSRGA
jgi:predicted nicotinamide N-methyase